MKTLHCSSAQDKLVPLLVRMTTKEAAEENDSAKFPVHLHGSLILQELLRFNKPIKVINSLLSGVSSAALRELLCDPRGCHITSAFMESASVGEKSRDGLVKALKVIIYDVLFE